MALLEASDVGPYVQTPLKKLVKERMWLGN
jgi:hypothetical protein